MQHDAELLQPRRAITGACSRQRTQPRLQPYTAASATERASVRAARCLWSTCPAPTRPRTCQARQLCMGTLTVRRCYLQFVRQQRSLLLCCHSPQGCKGQYLSNQR